MYIHMYSCIHKRRHNIRMVSNGLHLHHPVITQGIKGDSYGVEHVIKAQLKLICYDSDH